MAVASSNAIEKIRDYTRKISVVFSPVFFALAGAQFDIRAFLPPICSSTCFFIGLTIVAIVSKMMGCGVPAAYFFKSRSKGDQSWLRNDFKG